jgi:hypothetical protein
MSSINIDQSSQIHTRTGIVTSAGTILDANDNRRTVVIQNLNGTNPLFVKFGTSASSTDFDLVLKPGSATDDGLGGTLSFDVLSYTGIISVAGTTVRCTATDL